MKKTKKPSKKHTNPLDKGRNMLLLIKKKLRISSTLFLLVILASTVLIYLQVNRIVSQNADEELNHITNISISTVRSAVDLSIQNYLRSSVEMNLDIVTHFYQKSKKGLLTEEQARKKAGEILLSQQIGDTGYFYVVNSKGIVEVHPTSIVGDNVGENFQFVRDQMEQKEGYIEYMWANPGEPQERPKALYMKWFEPWDWIISASTYREEFARLVNPDDFRQELSNITIGETGYIVVLDMEGNVLIHPNLKAGTNIRNAQDAQGHMFIKEILEMKNGNIRYMWKNPGEEKEREKFAYFGHYPELDWLVMATSYTEELEAGKQRILTYILLQLLLVALLIYSFRRKTRVEKALKHSEAKYRRLAENSPAVVFQFEMTPNGEYSLPYISESVFPVTGVRAEEIMQDAEKLTGKVFSEDRQVFQERIQRSAQTLEVYHSVHRHVRQDGQIIWLEVRSTPERLPNGHTVWDGFFLDVTQQKKAENALAESNEKLKALFASMTEMVALYEMVYDENNTPVNYRVTDCNAAFSKTFGVREAVGKLGHQVYKTPKPPYLKQFAHVAATGEPWNEEIFFTPLNRHFAMSAISPAKNKFATIISDITQTKQFQQTIEAKNKELQQIIYVASHDLRSPLVNVDGYSQELDYALQDLQKILLQQGQLNNDFVQSVNGTFQDATAAIGHIKSSTREMEALIKGLLKLSRTGRAVLNIEPVDMNQLLKRVISTQEYLIKQTSAHIKLSDLPPCMGDSMQLGQVFSNLLGNALKYIHPDRKPLISISGTVEHGLCKYFVEDNGIGVAPDQQEKIFELFHRVDTKKTEGEGLGLTIVKQIMGRLDGEIKMESRLNQGSLFVLSLPAVTNT